MDKSETGRSTRLNRSTQFAGSGVRLARPACAIIQASVVEGIMACRDESRRLSPRHKDRSQGHFPITQKIQKFVEVPRVVQRLDAQKTVKIPQQTQRGQSPEGQTDPARSEEGQTRQDPARSEPRGPQQTQRGQRPEGQTRPSEVRALRTKQDPAWSKAQSGQSPKRPDRPSEVRAPPCL